MAGQWREPEQHHPHPNPYAHTDPNAPTRRYESPYAAGGPYGGPHGPQYGPPDGGDPAAGPAVPAGPPPGSHSHPLHWKELLTGILFRPSSTFWQMRDYSMWWPALLVTFLYGLLAIFGLDGAREEALNTTAGTAVPFLLVTGVVMVLGALLLSTVTHNVARQIGGNGLWAPTAGLAMLIMTLTDLPRLAVALFLGGADPVVQVLGWVTWLCAGVLFTMMVSRSHELSWPRALAASSLQLLSLLMLIKLGTL